MILVALTIHHVRPNVASDEMRRKEKMVKILKLTSGEEILAEIISEKNTSTHTVIKNPLRFQAVPDDTGRAQIALVPFFPFAKKDKEFEINVSSIVTVFEADDEISNSHAKQFGGIVKQKTQIEIAK